jgi:hypothetical protein
MRFTMAILAFKKYKKLNLTLFSIAIQGFFDAPQAAVEII